MTGKASLARLVEENQRLRKEVEMLRAAAKGSTVIANHAGATIRDLKAALKEAREALEFYADERRYRGPNQRPIPDDVHAPREGFPYIWDVNRDNGDLARTTIKHISELTDD